MKVVKIKDWSRIDKEVKKFRDFPQDRAQVTA
jgi:hypothetical protein